MTNNATFTDHTIAVYSTHDQAEAAIKSLSGSDFDIRNLSVIGQNYESVEHPIGFVNTGDRMWTWGKLGAFWGTIWGLLFGSAMMVVPGVGYFMFAGWIVAALEGAALMGGLAAIGAALASIGIPKDSVLKYQTQLKAGSFLVLAHGDQAAVERAKTLLQTTSPTSVDTYSAKQLAGVS